jgi:glycosyltransferase involved in cell wall biosynthesis
MDPSLGGVSQAVRTMTNGLRQLEIFNEVVSLDDAGECSLPGDSFTHYPLGMARGPWAYHPGLLPWLLTNLPRFDAVVAHGLWQYSGHALYQAQKKLTSRPTTQKLPKLFVMPHGMLDPWFQRASDRKLKALRNWLYWKVIENRLVNNADGLLFTCEQERRLAHEPFSPYHPRKELVVGLGVESPPAFTPSMQVAFQKKCPELASRPYLLFLSRIHPKKGVDLLLPAYERLIQENPEKELPELVIAGPGLDTPYGQRMQQYVESIPGLHGRVNFPGMLNGEAKWGALYGCEAFILPSHQENFGIAVVEALACGRPVLITDQVNIWREIAEGGAGLVEPDTEVGAFTLLKNWLELELNRQMKMRHEAMEVYRSNFDISTNVNKFIKAISF